MSKDQIHDRFKAHVEGGQQTGSWIMLFDDFVRSGEITYAKFSELLTFWQRQLHV